MKRNDVYIDIDPFFYEGDNVGFTSKKTQLDEKISNLNKSISDNTKADEKQEEEIAENKKVNEEQEVAIKETEALDAAQEEAISGNSAAISDLSEALASEIDRATSAETAIAEAVENIQSAVEESKVAAEEAKTAAEEAKTAAEEAISSVEEAKTAAEEAKEVAETVASEISGLTDAIANESERAIEAEAELQKAIDEMDYVPCDNKKLEVTGDTYFLIDKELEIMSVDDIKAPTKAKAVIINDDKISIESMKNMDEGTGVTESSTIFRRGNIAMSFNDTVAQFGVAISANDILAPLGNKAFFVSLNKDDKENADTYLFRNEGVVYPGEEGGLKYVATEGYVDNAVKTVSDDVDSVKETLDTLLNTSGATDAIDTFKDVESFLQQYKDSDILPDVKALKETVEELPDYIDSKDAEVLSAAIEHADSLKYIAYDNEEVVTGRTYFLTGKEFVFTDQEKINEGETGATLATITSESIGLQYITSSTENSGTTLEQTIFQRGALAFQSGTTVMSMGMGLVYGGKTLPTANEDLLFVITKDPLPSDENGVIYALRNKDRVDYAEEDKLIKYVATEGYVQHVVNEAVISGGGVSYEYIKEEDNNLYLGLGQVDGVTIHSSEYAVLKTAGMKIELEDGGAGIVLNAGGDSVILNSTELTYGNKAIATEEYVDTKVTKLENVLELNDANDLVGVILTSPNGTKFKISVDDEGKLHSQSID